MVKIFSYLNLTDGMHMLGRDAAWEYFLLLRDY